jgi:ABC-type nitrate/sulfonate/bicarbonate transport system ATPase subunit/ABC-type transporter Mla maintaining outer membrane lipid asymmetry permease subunit MlaE
VSDKPAALAVHGLRVVLPDGRLLVEDLSLEVRPGEVVVLLGGSGSGKSTFSRVLFEPEALERDGFELDARRLEVDPGELGLVPQRGALFDHLDVRDNVALALRYANPPSTDDPAALLARVGIDDSLSQPGVPTSRLSGGQAQRVAVARALAGKRKLLFLDEPSVGLDPHRVRVLARLIREQCQILGVAAIVVTHDVPLAADVADRLFVLDASSRRLAELWPDTWPGPMARPGTSDDERGRQIVALEQALVDVIARADAAPPAKAVSAPPSPLGRWARAAARAWLAPPAAAATALLAAPVQLVRRPRDFVHIAGRVLGQVLLRPLPFYLIVSALVGYTVLYVISKVGGAGVRSDAGIRLIGGSYVVALAPVLAAVLFVAASGNAVNAWLGSMALTRQTLALQALGVPVGGYLYAPAWVALGLGFLVVAAVFALGMLVGGTLLTRQIGLTGGFSLLTADLVDPRPERVKYVARAVFLVWVYAWGIASDVIAKGGADKRESDDVTRAMTRSVVACTLWVVTWELVSAVVVLAA